VSVPHTLHVSIRHLTRNLLKSIRGLSATYFNCCTEPVFCQSLISARSVLHLTTILLHTQSRMSSRVRTLRARMKVHLPARTPSGARIQVHARTCIHARARTRAWGEQFARRWGEAPPHCCNFYSSK